MTVPFEHTIANKCEQARFEDGLMWLPASAGLFTADGDAMEKDPGGRTVAAAISIIG